jgi:probable HAF family extracellular repeat protein
MRDLGTLGGGSSDARAVSGHIVVGTSQTPAGQQHAFAYDLNAPSPTMRDLGTLGGTSSTATAVSGHIVVGTSATELGICSRSGMDGCGAHGFAYDLADPVPSMRDLGTPGGVGTSGANAISHNIIVGGSSTADEDSEGSTERGDHHGFYYDLRAAAPEIRVLGDLGNASSQGPRRISTSALAVSGNIIVGESTAPDGLDHAVVWKLTN